MPAGEPTYGASLRSTPRPGRESGPEAARGTGPPARRARGRIDARFRILLLASLPLWAAACEVEFGGASLSLREPAVPSAGTTAAESDTAGPAEPARTPLAPGTRLLLARVDPAGEALLVPAARMEDGGLASVAWPAEADSTFPRRFVDAFLPPGAELPLHASGRRIGTVIPSDRRLWPEQRCPPVTEGTVLLLPGLAAPEHALAFSPPEAADRPERPPATRRIRIRTFAPILAENLLRRAGFEQAFLARRAALDPVSFTGDTVPGMAATYLVNDSLAPGPPPPGRSAALFFLARFDPRQGYVPVWSSVRIYADTAGKEAYRHLEWVRWRGRRVDFVRRITADDVRIAALSPGAPPPAGAEGTAGSPAVGEPDERKPVWTETGTCRALELLDAASEGETAEGAAGR